MTKKNPELADPAEKYIAAAGRLHYAGEGRLWLVDPVRGRVLEAPEEAAPVLQLADRFRTLREHRRALLEAGWQDDGSGSLDALLVSLTQCGLLRSRGEWLRRLAEAAPGEDLPPIETICWLTRDRPELLARSVESAIANLRRYGRRAELRVYDDTADAAARQAARDRLAELGREGFPVFYAGAEEKHAFADRLKERAGRLGVNPDCVEFGLFDPLEIGYSCGANSNAELLDTCGKLFLHADDDMVFRFAAPLEPAPGVVLSSSIDPTEVRFFDSRAQRETAVVMRDGDILSVHERFLGRTVSACLRNNTGQVDCDQTAPAFLSLLESGGGIAATMIGVCGDSGMSSSQFVLWLTGRNRELALESEDRYRSALRSREVLRVASQATLTHGTLFMKMGCGLDNRLFLPPFLPVLRNEDGFFAQCLRACLPQGLIAHLPLAALHLPEGRPDFNAEPRVLPGLADLLGALVRYLAPAHSPGYPEERLRFLGNGLMEIACRKPAEMREMLRALWTAELSRYLVEMERFLELYRGEPDYWAEDAGVWMKNARRCVSGDDLFLPADLAVRADPDIAMELTRSLIRRYGELLAAWPTIREAAQAPDGDGAGLARPL